MTERSVTASLHGIQFLQDGSGDLIEKLAEISELADFPVGTVISRQGEPAQCAHLIVEGKVSLEVCTSGAGCKRILTLGPGELLNWSALVGQARLTATARALEATCTVKLDGAKVITMSKDDPRLGYEFMQRVARALAKRLNATRLQLLNVYGSQMPETSDERPNEQRPEPRNAPVP